LSPLPFWCLMPKGEWSLSLSLLDLDLDWNKFISICVRLCGLETFMCVLVVLDSV
jgi:hypothetical protein